MDFKVRCYEIKGDSSFSAGNTYEVNNGVIKGDNGCEFGTWSDSRYEAGRSNTLENLNKWFKTAKFELIPDRPRICEVLGVEVGEHFKIKAYGPEAWINEVGKLIADVCPGNSIADSMLYEVINHPEKIIRTPQFSEDEKDLMRQFAINGYPIFYRCAGGSLSVRKLDSSSWIPLPNSMLPSITAESEDINATKYLEGLK